MFCFRGWAKLHNWKAIEELSSSASLRCSFPKSRGNLHLSLQNSALCVLALVRTEETGVGLGGLTDNKRSIVKAASITGTLKRGQNPETSSEEIRFHWSRMEFEPPVVVGLENGRAPKIYR